MALLVTILLTIRLEILGASSLKDKRRVLKSLMTRLRNSFNISIAEVGDNEVYRSAILGVAIVSNSGNFGHQVAAKVINRIDKEHSVGLADYETETV